jgi:hypothetical protein
MSTARRPRTQWQSWAVLLALAVLFTLFLWVTWFGSIIAGGCSPALNDAAFAQCDIAVGDLQRNLPWAALAIPAAIGVESRWRWKGSMLLVLVTLIIIAIVSRIYA